MRVFRSGFVAGVLISLGGMAYLSVQGGIPGAFLFSIGLLTVLRDRALLFTGKIPYIESLKDLRTDMVILFGNLCGTLCMGLVYRLACPSRIDYSVSLAVRKTAEGWRVIPLAMLCNVLIYIAVEAYNKIIDGRMEAQLIVVLCVMVFILSGFEHCIANAFYFTVAYGICLQGVALYLGLNIIGNALGGILARKVRG